MTQILHNFIDDSIITNTMGPLLTKTFPDNPLYMNQWMMFNITSSSYHQPFMDDVINKLRIECNLELRVNLLSRGIGHPTKLLNITNQAPEDTSHILFISTGEFVYHSFPTNFSVDPIIFPITLSIGDAILVKNTSDLNNTVGVYADNMNHFCVLYLEPKDLWP